MKIVTRKEFLKMPELTVYCKVDEWGNAEELEIKHETVGNDWYRSDLTDIDWADSNEHHNKMMDMINKGNCEPVSLYTLTRDGLFDEDQLFMVYHKSDISSLINLFQECLQSCKE